MATRADRIEAASRALLADLHDRETDPTGLCSVEECYNLAMVDTLAGPVCDACATGYTMSVTNDLSYAPSVRALVAALAEEP